RRSCGGRESRGSDRSFDGPRLGRRRIFLHQPVAEQHRDVGGREKKGEGERSPKLESDPEIGRAIAPYHFVEHRQKGKEDRPIAGELLPSVFAKPWIGASEHLLEQRSVRRQSEEEKPRHKHIIKGRLHLDDPSLVQHDREAAEDDHHDAREPQQRRDPMIADRREQHRGHHRDHESEGGHEDLRHGRDRRQKIHDEEDKQRTEVDQELPHALGFSLAAHSGDSPAIARATVRGSKGLRSSAFSPTPIAWIGRPNFSAAATRIPPRAVPSSLVMISPVTPALSRNTSTCASAFWPVVASSTSRTSCGASGLRRPRTRRILESSSIKCCLFWRRPAVSTTRTSI